MVIKLTMNEQVQLGCVAVCCAGLTIHCKKTTSQPSITTQLKLLTLNRSEIGRNHFMWTNGPINLNSSLSTIPICLNSVYISIKTTILKCGQKLGAIQKTYQKQLSLTRVRVIFNFLSHTRKVSNMHSYNLTNVRQMHQHQSGWTNNFNQVQKYGKLTEI